MIETDLADVGIDVGDDALMESRSWRWLQSRILGLLNRPVGHDLMGNPVFASRLQAHFFAPAADGSAREPLTGGQADDNA